MTQLHRILDPTKMGNEAQSLRDRFSRLVIGQDEAVDQIANNYQMFITGLAAPGRPVGNFLFLGPTGTGKTRTVEATAEALLDDPRAVIKIDCAEFQHSHEIAKLIGSPAGYLGHRETHALLSQEALDRHHTDRVKLSFVLFDEIEKASDALWNLLLGILDKATLTLGDGSKVDFSRAMIFMTSNVGAAEMTALSNPKLGFERSWAPKKHDEQVDGKTSSRAMAAARRKFTPEFINRIDKMVVFKPLGETDLGRILDIELSQVQQRILSAPAGKPFALTVSDNAKRFLLQQGTDSQYGARPLKRAIERLVVHPLSNLIATNQVNTGDWIEADFDGMHNFLLFTARSEDFAPQAVSHVLEQQSRKAAAA